MSKNLAVFLCIVLADLAVVSAVGSSIEQMAYAKNPKVSNVQVTNSNVLHNNNNNNKKNSIDSNCPGALSEIRDDRLSQRVDDGISAVSLSSSSSSSKTLSSCSDPISFNSCRKLDVSHSLTSTPPIDKTVKDSSITKDTAGSHVKNTCSTGHDEHKGEHKTGRKDHSSSLSRIRVPSGLQLPKNLIIPTCPGGGATSVSTNCCGTTSCPPIKGTNGADIIIATEVAGATIYALEDNDVIQCGPGDCITYGGPGDNVMMASSSNTAKLFGGSGNNVFIGSAGNSLMVGGKGDDQLYGGTGNDVMIGGGGTNYFDCGPNGNAIILDFNAKNGDTKAPNCKYTIAANTGVVPLPPG